MSGGKPPRRWLAPGRSAGPNGYDDVPELSADEVQRRVEMLGGGAPAGAEPVAPEDTGPAAMAGPPQDLPDAGGQVELTRIAPSPDPRIDRHRLLWRDSATILIFVVLTLLVAQAFPAGSTGVPSSSAIPSGGVVTGSLPPGYSLPPGVTLGPIVDPSIGIDATPTPIPAVTESPRPSDAPTPSPTHSAKPSAKPSPKPSSTPTHPPTPPPPTSSPEITPEVTPTPPAAAFTWSQSAVLPFTIDFTNASTGDTSWLWDFGDGTFSTSASPSHEYPATVDPTDYQVQLTVSGPGGQDSVTRTVTVSPA